MQSITKDSSLNRLATRIALFVLLVAVFIPIATFAADTTSKGISLDPLPGIGTTTNGDYGKLGDVRLGTADPVDVTARAINVGLQSLGLFSLGIFMYGSFLWIWARGNSETIEKAKEIMTGTAMGLVFILAAYGITQWAFIQLVYITKG